MSDLPPQGSGPHPTLAGNMLDPSVSADGRMSQGTGVGGTSEQHVKEEGAEHIKNTGGPDFTSSGVGSSEGGLSSGSGGVGGSAYNEAPTGSELGQTTSGSGGGLVNTALSYIGLGGKSGEQGVAGEDRNAAGYVPTSTADRSYEPQGMGYDPTTTSSSTIPDRSYGEGGAAALGAGAPIPDEARSGSGLGDEASRSGLGDDSSRDLNADTTGGSSAVGATTGADSNDPMYDTSASQPKPMDKDVTTGSDPTDSADPTTQDTATGGEEATGGEGSESREAKLNDKHASTRENHDAIPTAGGEKLGSKHWGESKMVPDNPKPVEESNVSSKDGQPTDQVRDNTNKNTGGASKPGSEEHKEGLMDKMKDKMHMGGHK